MSLSLKSVMQEYRTGTNNINILNIFKQLPYQICVAGLSQIDMTVLSNRDYEIARLNALKISIHKYLRFRHENYQVYLQKKFSSVLSTAQLRHKMTLNQMWRSAPCHFFRFWMKLKMLGGSFTQRNSRCKVNSAETIRRLKGLLLRRKYPNWEPNLTKSASPT